MVAVRHTHDSFQCGTMRPQLEGIAIQRVVVDEYALVYEIVNPIRNRPQNQNQISDC